MWSQLKHILEKAEAGISDRKVACMVVLQNGDVLSGYNIEKTMENIIHAEESIIPSIDSSSVIKEIHMMAGGKAMNIKYSMPCEKCSNLLLPFTDEDTKIFFYFNQKDTRFELNFHEISKSYKPFENIIIRNNESIDYFLDSNTKLNSIDKLLLTGFCEKLISIIGDDSIEIYITGSSCGTGGPKSLLSEIITGSSYWDIDLILIFPENTPENLESSIKNSYIAGLKKAGYSYDSILVEDKPSYRLEENEKNLEKFLFRKVYYDVNMKLEKDENDHIKDKDIPSTMDISVGKDLSSTITDKYIKRNWYMRLY
ncbi:MAG: hypothetical protein PHS92_01065 [Candidatus Gracilibacteria bacterium]|nr:hypothetical protein [Candidatus Gracilibacteria bacterium]